MSENLYAAPRSSLDDHALSSQDDHFHVVSTRKLLIMIFATAGLYIVYWYYKNWALHREATDDEVWPVPRAIFSILFTHSLLHHIADHDATGQRKAWDADRHATIIVLLGLANYVLSWTAHGSRIMSAVAMLTIIPMAMLLKQVQVEINARCGDPDGDGNDSITGANIAWMVAGALIWILTLIGLLAPR